jgi:eukaryotic-like serine/threonine-protein kinase
MSFTRRERIEAVFEEALERPTETRGAWLETECAGDPELLAEVHALLAAHEFADRLFPDTEAAPSHPERIGAYRVLRELGRGGMGVVYLAERADGQFQRRVAIKLVPTTGADDPAHRRFLAERQILAGLDHPNIARLLDGGVTEEGRPFLVLEYVEGLPITTYCERHRLGIEERLHLFIEVCAAVQHAHQNLVLHRDLKPGNILVTAAGQVRLLDFGIAKLLNPALSVADAPVTRLDLRAMTPEYASPEQVRGEALTTASDLYSLGVLLYELLAGTSPYRRDDAAAPALLDQVRDQDPEPPSVRAPTSLRRRLRGDLDGIVCMALRKEPGRRYASADLLALDVRRYLDGRPVLAHRGSRRYRAARFARRRRGALAAGALAVTSLLVGLGSAIWQARSAQAAWLRAEEARAETERALAQSEEVTRFLVALFEAGDPDRAGGRGVTADTLLARGLARIDELAGQPPLQARVLDVAGRVYQNLGQYTRAEVLLERGLELRRRHYGEPHPEVAAALAHLADVLQHEGRYREAEPLYRQALSQQRSLLGADHLELAETLHGYGLLQHRRGEHAAADTLYREALRIRQDRLGEEHPDAIRTQGRLGALLRDRGDREGAEPVLRRTLDLARRRWGDAHPEIAATLMHLASLHAGRGEWAAADSLFRETLEMRRRLYGPDHPEVAVSLMQVAGTTARRGELDAAQALYGEAIAMQRRLLGDAHPALASSLNSLALLVRNRGDLRTAERLFREALAIDRSAGEERLQTSTTLINLGRTLELAGRPRDAERYYREALDVRRRTLDPDHAYLASSALRLARLLRDQHRWADAEPFYREALDVYLRRPRVGADPVDSIHVELADLYTRMGRPDRAERELAQVVQAP